ncbi:hypothetical protein DACRYDRAFT_23376 [Dacryopinax primogenitus]|uniref:Methyltransferase n=1 Tax=Dacryopinax primogenitus (strain DJM 731) TaxID=1858805 RepID=M5FVY5_DACPD|nr:uncharacterized protein DACRYDRAFT_23376 [Dacryopinax primogenitus]EJT99789.1 hypothetical protein DACRYDRAFT_23376 [Dacryopinax primogenitus]
MPVATSQFVNAELHFLSPTLKEKPYTTSTSGDTNVVVEDHDVLITDLRSLSESELAGFKTDTSGFQWVKDQSGLKGDDFFDEEKIKNEYYPEIDSFLKKTLGARRTFIFDHTVRRGPEPGEKVEFGRDPSRRGPVTRAHVDQSPKAGAERVLLHLGEDAERLSKGRAQIVNVWRPIRGPVQDYPLTVADYRSINSETDLQPTDLIYPNRRGETLSVRFGGHQKWYYISDQQPDDVLLLKCYESEVKEGRALLTPHSAFQNPNAIGKDVLPRQSIEVRVLVFYTE